MQVLGEDGVLEGVVGAFEGRVCAGVQVVEEGGEFDADFEGVGHGEGFVVVRVLGLYSSGVMGQVIGLAHVGTVGTCNELEDVHVVIVYRGGSKHGPEWGSWGENKGRE